MNIIRSFYSQIQNDEARNRRSLNLTANETFMSATARAFLSSELGDRYYSGHGNEDGVVTNSYTPFTSRGLPGIGAIVAAAVEATKEMLGASEVNLSCLSGVHAMICAILSTTDPGDTVMTVRVEHGGHFGTRGIVERTGRGHIYAAYDIDKLSFDVDELASSYKRARAKALYLDVSFYLNPHNLREIREALGSEAVIIYDASHTLGLIMGQHFQSPFKEGANVICGNTHKTLPGPQKGMVAFRDKHLGKKANGIIDSGLYSSPHAMSMIALSTTILEMWHFGNEYARQTIANSNSLGGALVAAGFDVRMANTGRYSENHQVHLMTESLGDYRKLYSLLSKNNIVVNFDNALGGKVYIRLGTQEITRRGMKEPEMDKTAAFIGRALQGEVFAREIASFVSNFQCAHYSFDVRDSLSR